MTVDFLDRDDLEPTERCALHLISAACEIQDHEGPFDDAAAFERIMWHDDETIHRYGLDRDAYQVAIDWAWEAIVTCRPYGTDARFMTPPFWLRKSKQNATFIIADFDQ